MIIDTSYFIYPPLEIPNAKPTAGGANNVANLQAVIEEVEYQFFLNSIGLEQYNELKDQFESDGSWKSDALQKWKDLVDGSGNWSGLRYEIGVYKKSLIANYVYYTFLLEDQVHYTTTGLQRLRPENSDVVDPVSKLVREWNKFVTMYQGSYYHCYCTQVDNDNSLYHYLQSKPEDYVTDYFRFYELQNVWGI